VFIVIWPAAAQHHHSACCGANVTDTLSLGGGLHGAVDGAAAISPNAATSINAFMEHPALMVCGVNSGGRVESTRN
jgi:hypothetical protein